MKYPSLLFSRVMMLICSKMHLYICPNMAMLLDSLNAVDIPME
jgi:hypothetical protein